MIFNVNLFDTLLNFRGHTLYQSQIIELELRTPLNNFFFLCSNLNKIEVIIASFMKMLELSLLLQRNPAILV